jgi:hypothetical protein
LQGLEIYSGFLYTGNKLEGVEEMARKTKAQLVAERKAFVAANEAFARDSYAGRLMSVLERAVKQNFELTVVESKFVLQDRDSPRVPVTFLTLTYNEVSQEQLDELEWSVEAKEKAAEEYLRRETMRRAALSKLSQEERELLGV